MDKKTSGYGFKDPYFLPSESAFHSCPNHLTAQIGSQSAAAGFPGYYQTNQIRNSFKNRGVMPKMASRLVYKRIQKIKENTTVVE